MAKSNFEKVESVVSWVRDKKSRVIASVKKRTLVKCLSLPLLKAVLK